MEDVRRGWKGTNTFETLGIRETMRGRGRTDGDCWVRNNGSGRDTLLCGGEGEEEKTMVVDHVQDPKLS